ncbi:MAG: hypothetical protein OQK09_12300 [Colwellia sp.]|nr:hypothetical protein [Colwellia sp.]MCW9082285.1 hypothetical protein [Colwellia sp.]
MSEQLPISIIVNTELAMQFGKVNSIANKLEAQFNFQTMTANWYGDEDNIFFIQLHVDTPQSFVSLQERLQQNDIKFYSDDVFSFYEKEGEQQVLICHIAITHSELALLIQQHQLLAALLSVKLQKVLNLVAKQLNLPSI